MRILTFDTSTNTMYLTISENSEIKLTRTIESTKQNYSSAFLIPTIIELLKEYNLTMQDINAIGVNIGPGSFTGIRVTATIARVMGQNLDIPVIGIPSLEIYSLLNNTDKNALCLLDARKGKAYMGIYDIDCNIIQSPVAVEYNDALDYAKNNDLFIVADTNMALKISDLSLNCINIDKGSYYFGEYLAKLAYKHLKNTEQYKWYNLKPLYIQPPPISMPKAM